MHAPRTFKFGVLLLLGNGTFVSWADYAGSFKISFQQSTVCNSDASNKAQDILVQAPCTFQDTSNIANPHVTRCVTWEEAGPALVALNNTASNPCKVEMDEGEAYSVPRIVGTFYNKEYSYVTATVSINSSYLGNATFVNNVAKGSMQVFIAFNYSRSSNFAQGIIEPKVSRVWSRRINLFPNVTIKAEVLIRPRKTTIHNYWWDVPSLERDLIDYLPWNVESYISIPGSVAPGWTDVGKVFLRFDDRDELVNLFPPQDALAVVSGWGGFLSILLVVGTPAVVLNRLIFQQKVKKLIFEDKITFDEEVRTNRSQAVTKSYVQGGGKSIMTKTRNKSILGFLAAGNEIHLPFLSRDSSLPTADLPPRPRASPAKEGRKVRLSFQDQDMSASSPHFFHSTRSARGVEGERLSAPTPASPHEVKPSLRQHCVSFPSVSEAPLSFSTGLFRSGKVHAEPSTPSAARPQAVPVPPDEPLFPPERSADDTTELAPAAAGTAGSAPAAPAAAAAAAAAAPQEASHPAPGAVRDDSALLPFAARTSDKGLLAPADGPLFVATAAVDDTAMFGPGSAAAETAVVAYGAADTILPGADTSAVTSSAWPAPDTQQQQAGGAGPQPVGESREPYLPSKAGDQPRQVRQMHPASTAWVQDASADDLMEQGWGLRPSTSSHPLSQGAGRHDCSSCCGSSDAALRRTALACCSDTPVWLPPHQGSEARGVCEHDENQSSSHVAWSNQVSARLANTTSNLEEGEEGPGRQPVVDHQVASMAVLYDGDCFADDDEDENYEDVVRHATSECNALFHLRQVVKLVQRDSPFLTLWSDNLTVRQQNVTKQKQERLVNRAMSRTSSSASAAPFLPHTASEPRDGAFGGQQQELTTRSSPQGAAESSKAAMVQWGAGADAAAGSRQYQSLAASSQAAAQQYDPGFVTSVSLWQEDAMRQEAGGSPASGAAQQELLQQEQLQGPRVSQAAACPAATVSYEIKPLD